MTVINTDNLVWLKEQPNNSIDHIITDPPYLISFMGKDWDKANSPAGNAEFWKECLRVVKPGGYCLAFGHSRQHHRVMVAIEDAGWDVRDCLMWLTGQGFPKSHELSIKIDKVKGLLGPRGKAVKHHRGQEELAKPEQVGEHEPISEEAKEWQGWGNALKPAYEPIIMARKPFKGSLVNNVLEWGTGGLNIDGCRIGTSGGETHKGGFQKDYVGSTVDYEKGGVETDLTPKGRFPANVIFTHSAGCRKVGETTEETSNHNAPAGTFAGGEEGRGSEKVYRKQQNKVELYECEEGCPIKELDEQAPNTGGGHYAKTKVTGYGKFGGGTQTYEGPGPKLDGYGGPSRFFYCAKVGNKERNLGCEDLEDKGWFKPGLGGSVAEDGFSNKNGQGTVRGVSKNNHPTVKPVALMEWLVKLVSKEGQIILDPFAGSGSTGMACAKMNRKFIGLELDPHYTQIANRRIEHVCNKENE